jgi:hypothetical protein
MQKYPLIGVSIIAVVLLVLGSLTNVVGYQSVQSSNQKVINNEVDQKELLFQTIVDIANNKEIQGIILKSQITREGFFNSDVKFSLFNTPVLTKNQLKHMYLIGLILSKIISKSRMHSILERYQMNNQVVQKLITFVIEKDATLNTEMTLLQNSKCDCENDITKPLWTSSVPILCLLLFPLWIFSVGLILISDIYLPFYILGTIGIVLNCFWQPPYGPY